MILQLVILGIALGLNNALASVALGTMQMPRRHQLRTAILFAVFEALMPVIGLLIGESVAGNIGNKARFVGVAVLIVVGLYGLFKQADKNEEGHLPSQNFGMSTLVLAIALSLDNLSVGFGLGMFHVPVVLAASVFGVVSLLMTLTGLEVGRFLGSRVKLSADKLSGGVLLLVAGMLLLHP